MSPAVYQVGPLSFWTVNKSMNPEDGMNNLWNELAAIKPYGQMVRGRFVRIGDDEALADWQNQHKNTDILTSTPTYTAPHRQLLCLAPLSFEITGTDLEEIRKNTVSAFLYLTQYLKIPDDCVEVIYNAGVDGNSSGDGSYDGYGGDNRSDCIYNPSKMVLIIPSAVFNCKPTAHMPVINYSLAREMLAAGITLIDIDVYQRDHFLRLPNSINGTNGRYVIPLQIKELMYLDSRSIIELSRQPRAEDSFISPQSVPQATEWFAQELGKAEKEYQRQNQLQKVLLEKGWQIPPCIRRLLWAELDKNNALEMCRLVARFYSFIKASEAEIWQHLHRLDKRHTINDYQRLKAIVTFAVENPGMFDCSHPLLRCCCSDRKCFMAKLVEEFENPHLF